jgi:hypothetical protein
VLGVPALFAKLGRASEIRAMQPRFLWLALLPLLALQPALSRAADPPQPLLDDEMSAHLREAGEFARKATEELLRSFELLRNSIPRYGVPYLDEHGNIVIPRREPPGARPPGSRTSA